MARARFPVVLPAQIKDATFQMFETQYAELPIPPTVAAYLFTYAEFVLPICLVLGFATRFAALVLLGMTRADRRSTCMPGAVVVDACLLGLRSCSVLMSVGPGAISIDALIRWLYPEASE